MFRVHLLGTAGYHPSETRHTTCVLLPESGIVLDAGTSLFRVHDRIRTPNLDIFLTHAHLDHVCGLTFLVGILAEHPQTEVTVRGRADHLRAVVDTLFGSPLFPVPFPYRSEPLEETVSVAGWNVRWRAQRHPGGSLGYRFESPEGSFAFCTDTTADPVDTDAIDFVRGVDLLIHECNFPNGEGEMARLTGHSTAKAVGEVARAADVGRLVVTHFGPFDPPSKIDRIVREVAEIFPRCVAGVDGMVVTP